MDKKEEFKNLIEGARKSRLVKDDWQGTLLDYLAFLKEQEGTRAGMAKIITQSAHARAWRMMTAPGFSIIDDERTRKIHGRPVKSYKFFENDFFGMEKTIEEIVNYFTAAAMGGEQSRQILALIGPVGSGKSSLVEKIKQGLEGSDPIFAIKDCPVHEEPLNIIPRHLRPEIEKMLNVKIEGDLCPVCRHNLKTKFKDSYENMPVEVIKFSVRARRGIASVNPVDPNTQDTSELIGEKDISKLDKFMANDPRLLSLNGAFNAGNRGMVEFIEMFRNPPEYFHPAVTATQEKSVPVPGKQGTMYFDGIIFGHANEEGWNEFRNNPDNKLYVARIVPVYVPYTLETSKEVKIYKKVLNRSEYDNVHISPYALEIAARFAVMSRLAPSPKCDSLLTKSRLYDGEKIIESGKVKKIVVPELKEDFAREGLAGIDTRFVTKIIFDFLASHNDHCINAINLREMIIDKVKTEFRDNDNERKRVLSYLQDDLHKDYLKNLEKELVKFFVDAYDDKAEKLFHNYLDHVEAWTNKTKVKDFVTKEELEPDVKFMESIESQIGLSGSAAEQFRAEINAYMFHLLRSNEKINYKSYEPLKEAIEKKLVVSVKDLARVVTASKTRDKDQQGKYDEVVNSMIRNGYCESCSAVVLRFAANHIFRDN